jgi:hypothetical protein
VVLESGSTIGRVADPALKMVTPETEAMVGNPDGSIPNTSAARPAHPVGYGLPATEVCHSVC